MAYVFKYGDEIRRPMNIDPIHIIIGLLALILLVLILPILALKGKAKQLSGGQSMKEPKAKKEWWEV